MVKRRQDNRPQYPRIDRAQNPLKSNANRQRGVILQQAGHGRHDSYIKHLIREGVDGICGFTKRGIRPVSEHPSWAFPP